MSTTISEPVQVVVSGLGLESPHGKCASTAFDAMLRGVRAITLNTVGEAPHTVTIPSAVCCDVDSSSPLDLWRSALVDRTSQLALMASTAAWTDAGLDSMPPEERETVCVLLGTAVGGAQTTEKGYRDLFLRNRRRLSPLTVVQSMNNAAAAHVAQHLGVGGACHTYSMACASSAVAIADAVNRIRSGQADVVLAGGADAALPYGVIKAWLSMQMLAPAADDEAALAACRPFARDRRGLVVGEGSAMLVLERRERALARGARIYAEIAGSGSSCDHGHIVAPSAAGQLRALAAAMRDAGANKEEVAYVNAHGTATREGDLVEIAALRQFFGGLAPRLPVSATKSMHGHLMGASGAIEAVITVLAVQQGRLPPTAHRSELDPACGGVDHVLGDGRELARVPLALSNSFAFGGSNVVLAFRRWLP